LFFPSEFPILSPEAFLPLRKIRKCVPEFLTLNIFLYLTGYNTEEEI